MRKTRTVSSSRHWQAIWRDTVILFKEFRFPLLSFLLLVVGSSILYHVLSQGTTEPQEDFIETTYLVLSMIFLQNSGNFPHIWYLQVFYFLTPIIGVGILALGLAEFGSLFFNRKGRGKEWEMAIASTFSDHIVLVGLGHLGYRVAQQLHEMNKDVVVIELDPKKELTNNIRSIGIPVIQEDGILESTLVSAGIKRAQTIVLCTQNDSLNLQIAVKARTLNPKLEVVIRIFDNDFADSLSKQFGFHALSATGMAAPIFAASAAQVDITAPITIEGQPNSLARLMISKNSRLAGMTIGEIENTFSVSIVHFHRDDHSEYHPSNEISVNCGDTIAILGNPEALKELVAKNLQ
jgi:voltage-gated potassium channel